MTVPAEFPGTSFSCISIFPNKYWFLDLKPEPEVLSRDNVSSWPLLRILARPSPHVISKSLLKFPAEATTDKIPTTITTLITRDFRKSIRIVYGENRERESCLRCAWKCCIHTHIYIYNGEWRYEIWPRQALWVELLGKYWYFSYWVDFLTIN